MRHLTEKEAALANEVLADRHPRWLGEVTHVNFDKGEPNVTYRHDANPSELKIETYQIEFTAVSREPGFRWKATRVIPE